MTWSIRLVVCFLAVNSCIINLCDGSRLEDFLEEKHAYLREFDSLFDTFYLNTTSHQPTGSMITNAQRQVLRSEPLPSPDWSTHSISSEDVTEEEYSDDNYMGPPLSEGENYIPREEASGRDVHVDDLDENSSGDVFSGDSGLFINGEPVDDDEGYEDDLGSGDFSTQTTTSHQTTLILKDTTTSVPVEEENAVETECKDHLRTEIKSCIEFSFDVKTMFQEMENFVDETGYYNGSSTYYFFQLFRTCASTISSPPSCLGVNADENVMYVIDKVVTRTTTAFSHRNNDGSYVDAQGHFDCFCTHLQFLQSCLSARLTNGQLETLVRIIIVRAKDASKRECQDLQEVQQCVVASMAKCDDFTSVGLVDEMFEATKRAMVTCSGDKSGNGAAIKISLGSVVTLVLSILTLGLHKHIHN